MSMKEIEACISFIEHFVTEYGDNYVPFHSCPLKDAISELCFAPVRSRKLVALYLHHQNDSFSNMFCSSLEQIKNIIEKTYYIIGWDISNEAYHSALKKSLDIYINFDPAKQLIKEKHAALLVVYPIENSITIFSILHGAKIKVKDLVSALEQIQENFEAELKNEIDLEGIQKYSKGDIGSGEFQQLMHDRLAIRDYDCFEYDEHELLKEKIAFSKYGPPKSENGYDKKQLKSIKETYKQILKINNAFAEWTNQMIVSFIYNCLEPLPAGKLSRANKYSDYNPKTDISPIPLYVIQKCKGSTNPCKIFVDHDNRVYHSWNDYIKDNKLHKCSMVLPGNGFYKNDEDNNVITERHLTPSCGVGQMILKGTDIASTLVGLASGGVIIAAMIPTVVVAPVALTVATATGIGVGVYSMIRSAHSIYDRHTHCENMSFANSGARGAYINIIAGSLGFVGAGATTAVTELASKGIDIGQGAQAALNTLRMMNMSVTGASIANSTIDVVDDWMNEQEKPSYLTFLQLKSSTLFFTNYDIKKIETTELRNCQVLLACNKGRKRRKSLEAILYSMDCDKIILPITSIRTTNEIFQILQRNSELLPNSIIFTFQNNQIFLNEISVTFFNFFSRQLVDLPIIVLDNIDNETITLQELELSHLSATNANFNFAATVILKGFPITIKDKLINLFKEFIGMINVALFDVCLTFTKKESLTAILELLVSFLEFKANEKELWYIQEIELAKQKSSFNEDAFHSNLQVIKDAKDRALIWFEKCIDECVFNDLLEYEMSKLAEIIYTYCDNEEKRQRREQNSIKNAFKVNCKICDGYYFSKISV